MKELRPSAIMRLKALASSLAEVTKSLEQRNNSLEAHLTGSGWVIRPMTRIEPKQTAKLNKAR